MSLRNKILVVIAGPTAVGKTATAIEIAKYFKTEIISADSRQFYKNMTIGTAAPSKKELAAVPHHFIGNLELEDYYNVSIFEQEALKLTDVLFMNNEVVVVVGGSTLYVNALCYGIDDLPDADENLRAFVNDNYKKNGIEWLQKEVSRLDPEYYKIVDTKNPMRLMRAVEVCMGTGKTYTAQRLSQKKPRPFPIIKIALNLPREELFMRINKRVDNMMEMGLLEEAKSLYKYRNLNSLKTVGYKELFAFMDGKITLEQAVEDIKTNTRRYAKRQIGWFKKDAEFQWFSPFEFKPIIEMINQKLNIVNDG